MTAGTFYYLTDSIGSTIAVTDASGSVVNTYSYDPFGKIVGQPELSRTRFRFAGQYLDGPTSLYKIGARYYDPVTGRWTSSDPVRSAVNDHGDNGFAYADDDPVNITDPSGLTGDRGWMGPTCTNPAAEGRAWVFKNCPATVYCAHWKCGHLKHPSAWATLWNIARVGGGLAACYEGAEVGAVAGPGGAVIGCLAVALAFDIAAEQAKNKIKNMGN